MVKFKDEKQIAELGYLKQPNDLIAMRHSFDVVQGRVVSAVVEKMQNFISLCCKKSDVREVLKSFQDADFAEVMDGNLVLDIPYKDVGATSTNYEHLRAMLEKLSKLEIGIVKRDKHHVYWFTTARFCSVMFPYEPDENGQLVQSRYKRYFKVVISQDILEYLIDTEKGWSLYLRRVVMSTNNKYAFRFYMLMTQWRNDRQRDFTVSYLREWLQVESEYARWYDFYNRVIVSAEKELKKLFKKGICDLYFTTELIYPEGKKRGEPKFVRFLISEKEEVAAVEPEKVTPESDIDRYLFLEFTLTTQDRENILSLVTEENRSDFNKFCEALAEKCRTVKPNSISAYSHTALVKFLKDWKPKVVEVKAESIIDKYQKTKINKQEGVEIWDKVLSVCRDRMDADLFATWIKPLKYLGKRENKCFYHLPTSKFGREMYQAGAYDQLLAICRELYPDLAFETK